MAKKSSASADEKSKSKKGQNKVAKWFKDLRIEFKKVVWPSRKTVVTNTSVVLGVVVLSSLLMFGLDEGFLALLRLIYNH